MNHMTIWYGSMTITFGFFLYRARRATKAQRNPIEDKEARSSFAIEANNHSLLPNEAIVRMLDGREKSSLIACYEGWGFGGSVWTPGLLLIFKDESAAIWDRDRLGNYSQADYGRTWDWRRKWRANNPKSPNSDGPLVLDLSLNEQTARKYLPLGRSVSKIRESLLMMNPEYYHDFPEMMHKPINQAVETRNLRSQKNANVDILVAFQNYTNDWDDDGDGNRWISGASLKQEELFLVTVSHSDFQFLQEISGFRRSWR